MTINSSPPQITMPLFETDIGTLEQFMANEKIEGELTENYLVLYDFAGDCMYSTQIQPELMNYLLPFYFKVIEQAVLYDHKVARDVYCNFNSALFINQKCFRTAVGEKTYQSVMEYYIEQVIKRMAMENIYLLDWISLFNTAVAFHEDHLLLIFHRIREGSLWVKRSFFNYLSVLLFKESDHLLAVNESKDFWTNSVWYFDSEVSNQLFWSNKAIAYFDQEIGQEKIEALFKEVEPLFRDIFADQWIDLVREEINRSFTTGVFSKRKAEYLQKMNDKDEKCNYWDSY